MTGKYRSLYAGGAFLALVSAGTAASAQSWGDGNWYLKGFGGASFLQENEVTAYDEFGAYFSTEPDYDTGYIIGGSVGYQYSDAFSFELEYAYRRSDLSGASDTNITGGNTNSNAITLNGYYAFNDLISNQALHPYLGAGIGAIKIEQKTTGDFPSETYKNDGQLAFQFMAGIGYDLNPKWTLMGEVRYLSTENKKLDGPLGTSIKMDYNTIDLLVGAAYKF